ncbi:Tc toxin subunit A [Cellulophaga baltica 4]|nr:Tc toxin subunit A [Cellulophaga baltica 4]
MIPNIQLNETSPVIAVLHKMMQLLHLKVDDQERMEQRAGDNTQERIRAFQEENKLPIDAEFVVDKPTINFMLARLGQLGYLDSKMRRTISGKVVSSSGQALHRVPLGAMDLDLPAISKYKSWKSTQELIAAQDTIEFLGLTESGQDGFYKITFYDWMYEKSERRSADVVVFALNNEDDRTGDYILGRSALFQNVGYHTSDVDIRIEEAVKESGEYKPLLENIVDFLQENKMELSQIFGSSEQISFVASELHIPLEKVQHIVQANALDYSIQENLNPELLYGLAQQKIALDWESLHRSSIEVLGSAIAKDIAEKDIDTFSQAEINKFIDTLKTVTAAKILEPRGDESNIANELLTIALPSQNERIAYTKATNTYTGTDENEFWEKYLPEQTDFKPDTIQNLRNNQKLFLLSEAHLPLVSTMAEGDVKELSELVTWNLASWEGVVKKSGIPAHIEGKNEADKIKKYATNLRNNINREYPTAAVHHKINNNELSVDNEVRQPINQFLSTAKGFDIKKSRIKDFQDDIDVVAGGNSTAVTKELNELQRLVRINPDTSLLQTLKDRGLTSAFDISEIPQKTFIVQNSEFMGGEQYAKILHANATFTTAKVNLVKNRFQTALESHVPKMIRSTKDREAIEAKVNEHWPGYSEVFNVNSCECGHCNSVYGPAAYFVDLMRFLGLGFADENDQKNPQKVFKDRRPDLFHLPLTCENSNTLIPYIDLANEVMENYIYYSEEDEIADDYNDYESADTGDLTEEELRAQPQNIRKETYLILAKTIFPFSLPFHLPLEILYAYFNQLGTSWHEVLDKTNDVSSDVIMRNLNAAYLQLSETEYALLSDEKFNSELEYSVPAINDFYGLSVTKFPDLSQVPVFLKQTGLAYTDLVQLLYTNFINPQLYKLEYLNLLIKEADVVGTDIYENLKALYENEGEGTILPDILDSVSDYGSITESGFRIWITKNFESLKDVLTLYQPSSACDLSTTELKTLKSVHDILETVLPENILVRMHKFIRLWRKTSWSIQELDVILSAFGNVLIDTEGVNHISFAKQFIDSTNLSPKEAALLWGNFHYRHPNNLYATLFLKKSLKINNVFIPAPGKSLFTNLPIDKENLSNYMSDILAAFRISETTLDSILEHLGLTKTGRLTLENLSAIYRYKLFAESCDIKVQELVQHINLFNLSPFENPEMSVEAFTKIKKVESSDFTLETLGYIFGATEIDFTALVLKEEEIAKQSEILAQKYALINEEKIAFEGDSTEAEIRLLLKRILPFSNWEISYRYQQLWSKRSQVLKLIY